MSGPLPSTGSLSMTQINGVFAPNATELGRNPNALGAYRGTRHDAGLFPSSTISFSHFRGRRRRLVLDITTAGENLNMRSIAVDNGWDEVVPLELTVRIQGVCSSNAVGAYAFDTGTDYPAGSILNLVVNPGSIIVGRGGNGGMGGGGGGCGNQRGDPGGNGGPALNSRANITLNVTNNGTISGGGGGGGGGGGDCNWNASGGNGGGGAGFGQTHPSRNFCGVSFDRAGWPGGNGTAFNGGGGGGSGNGAVGDGGWGGGLGLPGRRGFMGGEPGNNTVTPLRCPQPGGVAGFPSTAVAAPTAINWVHRGDVRNAAPVYTGPSDFFYTGRFTTELPEPTDYDGDTASYFIAGWTSPVSSATVTAAREGEPARTLTVDFWGSWAGFVTLGVRDSRGAEGLYSLLFEYVSDGGGFTEAVQCVAADTSVLMQDGSTKEISALVPGEFVSDGEGGAFELVGLHSVPLGDRDLLDINGVRCSPDHPIMTIDGWRAVDPERARKHPLVTDTVGEQRIVSRYDAIREGLEQLSEDDRIITLDDTSPARILNVPGDPNMILYAPILKNGGHFVANKLIVGALRVAQINPVLKVENSNG